MIKIFNGQQFKDKLAAIIIRKLKYKQICGFNGKFKFECFDLNQNLKWVEYSENITVDEGLNNNLSVYFKSGSASANWYIGLIGSNSTPLAGWDAAGIGVDFTEYTNYSEATRETWVCGDVSGKSLDNSASPAEYNISGAGGTIYGAFVINENTKEGTTGIMWCASLLAVSKAVTLGDIVRIQYTISNQDV